MNSADRTATPSALAVNYDEFLDMPIPARVTMLGRWLPVQGLTMVHAPRGLGKTHVALGIAWAVATGTGFLVWNALKAHRVVVLDGEMPAAVLQERLAVVSATATKPQSSDYLKIAAADLSPDGLPDLADPNAQASYMDIIGTAELVVVDNISTLCRSLKENDADSWVPVQSFVLALRRAGKSVVLIHHDGKAGTQRGTSRKEDVLDTVISLRRPPDYDPSQGARFEIHFEKSRGFYGSEAEPFEAHLVDGHWQVNPIKSGSDVETLMALHKLGLSIRDISERTGVPKSTVHRLVREIA